MARIGIQSQSLLGGYPELPLTLAEADLIFTAPDDPISRSTPIVSGKTVIFLVNTDASPHTVTFTGVKDSMNRSGDISNYSVAAGAMAAFGPFQPAGWAHPGNLLYIDIDDPKLRISVVQLN